MIIITKVTYITWTNFLLSNDISDDISDQGTIKWKWTIHFTTCRIACNELNSLLSEVYRSKTAMQIT